MLGARNRFTINYKVWSLLRPMSVGLKIWMSLQVEKTSFDMSYLDHIAPRCALPWNPKARNLAPGQRTEDSSKGELRPTTGHFESGAESFDALFLLSLDLSCNRMGHEVTLPRIQLYKASER